MYDIVLKGGTIYNCNDEKHADIGIKQGKIEKIGEISQTANLEIDAKDHIIIPGVIDPHTHMGIPMMGTYSVDDFKSGSVAASYGGVTTIIDFTVQEKGDTLLSSLERRLKKAKSSHVDYSVHVNITEFYPGFLKDMAKVMSRGIKSFKLFLAYAIRVDDGTLIDVMRTAKSLDGIVMLHAENGIVIDHFISEFVKKGLTSTIYHGLSRPPFTEEDAVGRAILFSEYTGASLYLVHMTTARAKRRIKKAKSQGIRVYGETCPQYLYFTEDIYKKEYGFLYLASPPFRKIKDVEALWKGLIDGTFDTIGTDHAPFTASQKKSAGGKFHLTPNGLSVIEFLLPSIYTGFIKRNLPLHLMPCLLAHNQAQIFGLSHKGTIAEGYDADIAVIDPAYKKKIIPSELHSVSDYSIFQGMEMYGIPRYVMARGDMLINNYNFVGFEHRGKFVKAEPGKLSGQLF